jgi:hypothetical protein
MSNINQSTDGTLEQIAEVIHDRPNIHVNQRAKIARDEQDKRQELETKQRQEQRAAQTRYETIRNLLTVVNNPTSDEVIKDRAARELDKFKGVQEVDDYFQFLADERKRAAYKAKRDEWLVRANALKEKAIK